jgi:c-di-GMP-binding flagellar brake protein YcgR
MEINQWIREDRLVNVSFSSEGEDWYASKVLKVDGKSFFIAPIIKKTAPSAPVIGSKIRVSIPSGHGLLLFTTKIMGESKEPEPSVELEYPQDFLRMERRAYPRLPMPLETYYSEIRPGAGALAFARSQALDISGGGALLETHRPCPQETLVRLKFLIPIGDREEELVVIGRIARSYPAGAAGKNQVGVEFIDITPRQQESLMQFVAGNLEEGLIEA